MVWVVGRKALSEKRICLCLVVLGEIEKGRIEFVKLKPVFI